MRDYHATQDASRPPSQQEPYLTPYLGLRARLSQTWINRWTVLLLLVLIRTLFALASLDRDLGSAKTQALSTCTSVENVGSALASMPYYLAEGVNDFTAKGIEKALNGLIQMLLLTVTGVEELILFVINVMTSTYVCLITLAVSGSLHVAIDVAEDVGNFLNATIKDVGHGLADAEGDFQKVMNGFLADLDKIGDLFTHKHLKPPTLNLSSEINSLNSVQLPIGYDQGLSKLNSSIPTFAQVQNFTNTAISWPFNEVKTLLNESLPKYSMNSSIFPVPDKQYLHFCTDDGGVEAFFADLVHVERVAEKAFLITIIILAILAMIPMAYRELRRYRFMKNRAQLLRKDAVDPMDAVYLASRPYTSLAGLKIAQKFKSGRRRSLVRWSVAYATTVPALFVLSLGLAGLLGCLCQFILLKAIEKEVPSIENDFVGFADKVIDQLNNASEQWSTGTNLIINDTNNKINHDVFGWVNITTHAVNNTLNTFVDEMMKGLNETFGGTVLYDPILDVLNCLVLLKIEGIEKGLTWISDHAYVDFPTIPNNTFSLGTIQKVSGSEADILNTGPHGGVAEAVADGVYHVTNALQDTIRQEAIISTCILIIWGIIALIGISRAAYLIWRGGDDDMYSASQLPNKGPSPSHTDEKQRDMDDFLASGVTRVPTYEQATQDDSVASGDNTANRYNGQAYTLRPNPVPQLVLGPGTSPILRTGFSPPGEKFGTVNGQNIDAAIRRPTHYRVSSHGDLSSALSPTSHNPFPNFQHSSTDDRQNPFADPTR